MLQAKETGIDAYLDEQRKKKALLDRMLNEYDDGFHDVFFCLAVNMLALDDLTAFLDHAAQEAKTMQRREKAVFAEQGLRDLAKQKGIPLVLRKW